LQLVVVEVDDGMDFLCAFLLRLYFLSFRFARRDKDLEA
jgi:hypothetical protein